MLSLLCPDSSSLLAPSVHSGSQSMLWLTLGRARNGVAHDQKISRSAVELTIRRGTDGASSVWIRVLSRNAMLLSHPPASDSAASTSDTVTPGKETEWRVGSTLYLLAEAAGKLSWPFTLRLAEAVAPSLSFDADMTQDVDAAVSQQPIKSEPRASIARSSIARSPMPFPSLSHDIPASPQPTASQLPLSPRPTHAAEADQEMKAEAPRVRSSRKRPIAETLPAPIMPLADDTEEPPAAAAASAAAPAAPSAAAAAAASDAASAAASSMHAIAPAAASAVAALPPNADPSVADFDFPLDDDDFNFAQHRADEAAAAAAAVSTHADAASNEPASKKLRPNQAVVIKRDLDSLSTPASSLTPAPRSFLSGFAIFIVADGIGSRQLEILHSNISKRGGLLLKELPRHRFHVVVDRDAKKKEKARVAAIQKTHGAAAAADAAAAANASVGERKLNVLILVSSNIRTKKQLTEVLARRARLQAASDSALSARHLGVPSATTASHAAAAAVAAAAASPPSSPKPAGSATNSPASVASGSSAATAATIKIRSNWQVHTIEFIIEAFKHNQLPAAADYLLDDADSAADTVGVPTDGDDDDEAEEDSKYADEEESIAPTNAAAIAAWNGNIAAQLKETAEKYSAQHGEHFRALAFRRAAGVIGSLPYALKDVNTIRDVKGLGPSTLDEARAIIETGRSSRLEALKSDPVLVVHQLLQTVHGVGPKTAEKLYAQGIRTIDDLRTKVKLTSQQATYLQHYDELRSPIPRGEVTAFEKMVNVVLHQINPQLQLIITGSYRRGKATCGDIDCLITHPDPNWQYSIAHSSAASSSRLRVHQDKSHVAFLLEELLRRLHALDLLTDDLVTPSSKQRFKAKNIFESKQISEMACCIGRIPADAEKGWGGKHRRIDFKFYHISEHPFALLYFTGSKDFNRQMRLYANVRFGYSLSDHALSPYLQKGKEKVASGIGLPCASEADVFAHLKMPYVPPTDRDKVHPIFLQQWAKK